MKIFYSSLVILLLIFGPSFSQSVVINELMNSNDATITDATGEDADRIENNIRVNGYTSPARTFILRKLQENQDFRVQFVSRYADLLNTTSLPSRLTVNVSSENSGYVKINTIEIVPSTEGVGAVPYPWNGIYFRDVPVTLIAKANPGQTFKY